MDIELDIVLETLYREGTECKAIESFISLGMEKVYA